MGKFIMFLLARNFIRAAGPGVPKFYTVQLI